MLFLSHPDVATGGSEVSHRSTSFRGLRKGDRPVDETAGEDAGEHIVTACDAPSGIDEAVGEGSRRRLRRRF